MKRQHQPYLKELGVQLWQHKSSAYDAVDPATLESVDWQALQNEVTHCGACPLHRSRTQTVFGNGNHAIPIMIIGEAPGFHEDKQGEPFVGRAGKLLTNMLRAIEIDREDIFTTNILKCRPPNNRDPEIQEIEACTTYLDQQISYLKPKLIVAVGRIAAHHLLKTKATLSSLRGKLHAYGDANIPLIATYHPAYLLRNPIDKKKALIDLLFIQREFQQLIRHQPASTA